MASSTEAATAFWPKVEATTIAEAFRQTVQRRPHAVAFRTKDDEVSLTWAELAERVDAFAAGLAALGVRRGDTVALMLTNRPEFHVADLAVMALGATPFSVYLTSAPEQIAHMVADAQVKTIIVEQAFVERIAAARAVGAELANVVVLEGASGEGTVGWADVEAGADPDFDVQASSRQVRPEDLATLIYTSGTTGAPKAVEISHRNLIAAGHSIHQIMDFPQDGRLISWLPSAHIAERVAHHYIPVLFGLSVTTCPDSRRISEYLAAVHPQWFVAVPRVWQKIRAGLETMVSAGPPEVQERIFTALQAAIRKVELVQAGEPVPEELAAAVAHADAEMFAPLRAGMGLDQTVIVSVAAAATPRETLVFFHALGIEIGDVYGLSETCALVGINPPGRVRIGTVGPPIPGIEVDLADDGEILVRSDVVMEGYRNDPERTAAAVDADGWLHTGDVGEWDEHGYLRVVDRKKELIINAAGKNMSPVYIEGALSGASSLFGHTVVIGDGRRYNVALFTLEPEFTAGWAARNGLEGVGHEELAAEPKVLAAVQEAVDAANAKLSRVEQIKRWAIVPGDWAPGGDELTPTLKLKRRPIEAKYADLIDGLYAE